MARKIIEGNIYDRFQELLINQVGLSGPNGFIPGSRITESTLNEYKRNDWWQFALKQEKRMNSVESLKKELDMAKQRLQERFEE